MISFIKTFLIIWIIGAICSLVPFIHVGLIFGFYAYTLNALVLTIIYTLFKPKNYEEE